MHVNVEGAIHVCGEVEETDGKRVNCESCVCLCG